MDGFHFIGIYSGNPPKANSNPLDEPSLWNVYLKKDENIYIVQKLDKENQGTSEQYKISPSFFGINFRQVKNAPLKRSVEKNLQLLDTDKNSHESFFASFFKNHSAFNSIFQHHPQQNTIKKTNEFAFQMGANAQKNPYKATEDDITLVQSSSQNQSKEFQLSLSAPAAPKENSSSIKNTDAKYSVYNKDTDQHPFDEKFSTERFGLDSILSSLNNTKPQTEAKKTSGPSTATNSYGLQSKQLNSNVVLVHHNIGTNKPEQQNIDGDSAFFDSLFKEQNDTPSASQAQLGNKTITSSAGDDGLLPAKGNKSTLSLSEKAQKLDNALRAEFQVSLNHWYMSKKNMAMRQFHNIINKEANFVPAHKHMFTDFAIQLRKINQHDLALVAAIRCTKLSPDDSHAFFNVARLFFELGRYEKANEYIDKTLSLENDLAPAIRLSGVIKECLRRKAINK